MRFFATAIRLATLIVALTMSACAARLRVSDISQTQPNTPVDGIPFRVIETQEVVVFQRQTDGTYKEVLRKFEHLPNMDELYALNLNNSAFSTNTLAVTINPDSTLKISDLKADVTADQAFTALGSQVQSLTKSVTEYEIDRANIARRLEESRGSQMSTEFNADFRRAFRAALDADYDFSEGRGNYTQQEVDDLKREANKRAQLANKPAPFKNLDE